MTAPEGFTTEASDDERGYRLTMRGELDIAFGAVAQDALVAAELEADGRMLILDLGQLDFCGSVAVPIIAAAQKRSVINGHALLILPSAAVRRLFKLAGVSDDFDVEEPGLDGGGPSPDGAGANK